MAWTTRIKPSSTWNGDRKSVGDFRITEDGDFRVTENLFFRILEFISWGGRIKPITNWINRIQP